MADLSDWLCREARGDFIEQRAPGAALFEIDRAFLALVKKTLGLESDELALAQALQFVLVGARRIAAEKATALENWKPRREQRH